MYYDFNLSYLLFCITYIIIFWQFLLCMIGLQLCMLRNLCFVYDTTVFYVCGMLFLVTGLSSWGRELWFFSVCEQWAFAIILHQDMCSHFLSFEMLGCPRWYRVIYLPFDSVFEHLLHLQCVFFCSGFSFSFEMHMHYCWKLSDTIFKDWLEPGLED